MAITACVGPVLMIGVLCSAAPASAPSISDGDLKITLQLPEGFEPIPGSHPPPNTDIRYAFGRMGPDGKSRICVLVHALRGVIGRERIGEAARSRLAGLYLEKWKSFELEVLVVKEDLAGGCFVTRNVQVPVTPRAIQLSVVGPQSQDAELAELTRTLLASMDGPTNWLTTEERVGSGIEAVVRVSLCVLGILAVVYGLVAWRTRRFRERAAALGLPAEWARQPIRPRWGWYLLGAYLLLAGLFAGSMIVIKSFDDFLSHRSKVIGPPVSPLGVIGLSALGAMVITWVVWRGRSKHKRRILAGPPAGPVAPASGGGLT
jgi:uncharacterized membrane protein